MAAAAAVEPDEAKAALGFSPKDSFVVASPLGEVLNGHVSRGDEASILALLEQATAPKLNAMLASANLDRLLDEVEDHLFGKKSRTALFALLFDKRLDEISIANRARLIHGLQANATTAVEERAALKIFLATHGADVTALKNAIDGSQDHRDLFALAYQDIDDEGIRAALLDHIKNEAAGLPKRELKIFSDIDDTLYPNWSDKGFPKKVPYPGVRQFYRELDRGPREDGRPGDLVFLTARPDDPAGVIEDATRRSMSKLGLAGAVLGGALSSALSNTAIARKKVDNFERYRVLYPEYDAVFIGDSGQGDAVAGADMLKKPGTPMRVVFIHDVTGIGLAERAEYLKKGIVIFTSYVTAACAAYERGLISQAGLGRVLTAAELDFARTPFTSALQRSVNRLELDNAKPRAEALLKQVA